MDRKIHKTRSRALPAALAAALPALLLSACGGSSDGIAQLAEARPATLLSCTDLAAKISFPNTRITAAETVRRRAGGGGQAHCRALPRDRPHARARQHRGWPELRRGLRDAPAARLERALLLPGQRRAGRRREHGRGRAGRRAAGQRAADGLCRAQLRCRACRQPGSLLRPGPAGAAGLWLPGRGQAHAHGAQRAADGLWQGA